MSTKLVDLRDQVVTALLPHIPFDGWTWTAVQQAVAHLNLQDGMETALFPDGVCDVVAHFSDMMDRAMLRQLDNVPPENMRVRDRIETAVGTRLNAMTPHKDAIRLAMAYWSVPPRHLRAARLIWRTADRIWTWAGDTATDYNRQTKRTLLSGVLTATTLAWLKDDSPDNINTHEFLHRRIENIMQFGQILGRFKSGA